MEWVAFLNLRAEKMKERREEGADGKPKQLTDPAEIKAALMSMPGRSR
jgi:hypothetical protein